MRSICKTSIALGIGLLSVNAVFAQQGTVHNEKSFFSKNVYVSASIGNQWLTQGHEQGRTFTSKITLGSWFNKYSGFRLHTGMGIRKLNKLNSTGTYSVGVDYMLNVLPVFGDYNPSSPISFSLGVGGAYNLLNWGNNKEPSFNMNIQMGYDFTPHWGVYGELSGDIMRKFYTASQKGGSISCDISVGLRYRFSRHSYNSGKNNAVSYDGQNAILSATNGKISTLEQEIARLNNEINEMRKRLDEQQSVEEKDKDVMVAPKEIGSSIDIFFDKFSSFINDNQLQKINAVGKWMKNNTFDIRIVAFSDNLNDKATDDKLRKSRTDAIRNLLIREYGIKPERISIVRAEELGYKNLTGCNAKIIFLENEQ